MRKPLVAGNWKMNTSSVDAVELAVSVAEQLIDYSDNKVHVAVCPPYVYLQSVIKNIGNTGLAVGAQDVYFEKDGAFTGEISVAMLKDIGCIYAICGHSERRHVIGETDELINKKVLASINGGLLPILCVGELLAEREKSLTEDVVTRQLKQGLAGISKEKARAIVIAYEPVWAIGTGLTATPQQAQEVHKIIRDLLTEIYDAELAQEAPILYGGSVKPDNTKQIMEQPDVDGVLVGGASLKHKDFLAIIAAASDAKGCQ